MKVFLGANIVIVRYTSQRLGQRQGTLANTAAKCPSSAPHSPPRAISWPSSPSPRSCLSKTRARTPTRTKPTPPSNTPSHSSSHTPQPQWSLSRRDKEPHGAAVRVRSDVMYVHRETLNVGRRFANELEFDREGAGESVQVAPPSGRRGRDRGNAQ